MTTSPPRSRLLFMVLAGTALGATAISLILLAHQPDAVPMVYEAPVWNETDSPEDNNIRQIDEVTAVDESSRETEDDSDYDIIRQAQHQQIQYLQEIFPDTRMIPTEKTQAQVEVMLEEMALHRELQQRIANDTATAEDREHYVRLHRQKLEQEQDLIAQCQDVAANSLESAAVHESQLCTHMSAQADQRLTVITEQLAELDNRILLRRAN